MGGVIKLSVSHSDTKDYFAHLDEIQGAVTGGLGMRLGCCLARPFRLRVREMGLGSDNKLVPGFDRARYRLRLKLRENSDFRH